MPDIAALLVKEIAVVLRLTAVLTEEQDALKQSRVADLQDVTARKLALIDEINRLEADRLQLIGEVDIARGRNAMEQWLSDHPADTVLAVNWKKLLDSAREAQHLHAVNAQLIDMQLRQTTEILAVLTQSADAPSLYGASGQTTQATTRRIVDSA